MASVDAFNAHALFSDPDRFSGDLSVQEKSEQVFARKYIALLNQSLSDEGNISDDVSARLKAARNRAVAARKIPLVKPGAIDNLSFFWRKIFDLSHVDIGQRLHAAFCVAPLVFLLAGLFLVADVTQETTVSEKAVVDMQILVDLLPTEAYLDRGFLQFMKQVRN